MVSWSPLRPLPESALQPLFPSRMSHVLYMWRLGLPCMLYGTAILTRISVCSAGSGLPASHASCIPHGLIGLAMASGDCLLPPYSIRIHSHTQIFSQPAQLYILNWISSFPLLKSAGHLKKAHWRHSFLLPFTPAGPHPAWTYNYHYANRFIGDCV